MTTCINTAGVQYVRDHLATLPRPDREAKRAIADWLIGQNISLDPDQIDVVTLHLHPQGLGQYLAQVMQRVSLTQAVLINWQGESNNDAFAALLGEPWAGRLPTDGAIEVVDQLPAQPLLDNGAWYQVFNGLFRRTEPARFDATTHLAVSAQDLQRHIESLDFHDRYIALLDTYWSQHLTEHRLACKLNFIAACNKQVSEGSLSDAARRLAWRAAGLLPRGSGLRASTLNIYGYAATDLLYLNDARSGLTLLYIPGNSSPLLEFASEPLLRDWVGAQCRDARKRQRLKAHFRLADAPQGLDFSGLDTALEGLGAYPERHALPPEHGPFNDDGTWPPRTYVNYRPGKYNPRLRGDLFQAMAERQRQRSYDDARFIITSNGEVEARKWRGYLNATLNLALPLTFVVPGLAPLLAVGGIVQLGLGLDQAITGKTLQDKLDGVGDIAYGLLNAVPLPLHALSKADALFQTWREGFVAPRYVNDQWGYPLSPLDAPRLPPLDVAPYFHRPARMEPLPGGHPAVAAAVRRYPRYSGEVDALIGYYEPLPDYAEELDLIYDMEHDLFLTVEDFNAVQPTYYEAEPGTGNLRRVSIEGRQVTDAMRRSSLLALGIDVPLPLPEALMPVHPLGAEPIPKQILSVWVGDRVLPAAVLDTLAANGRTLQGSAYRYRLFLSNRHPEVYARNLAALTAKAPEVEVLPLEAQGFFQQFQAGAFYAQYEAALEGNGGVARNFSSASDVLRYPMLHSEGGVYMDVDDRLLTQREATGQASTAAAIDTVPLLATPDALLLHPAMQNEALSMNGLYNTSMIGSQAGNPTLLAVSEEMRTRYLATPQAYQIRPDRAQDPRGFYRFASELSRLTGPALLTEVVDRHLPDLALLRQLCNLYLIPCVNTTPYIDAERLIEVCAGRLPFRGLARVGHLHSWASI